MSLFSTKPKRHVLKDARVVEVSAVDVPAQEPALILLRKRGASAFNEIVLLKSYQHMPERMAYGIAAVSTVNGSPYWDLQGDHIPTPELVKTAHAFITDHRVGGALHLRDPETGKPLVAGRVVESCVLTKELQRALGIDIGKEAWIIGMKIEDPHVLRMIESGHLRGFSVGGSGKRVGVEKMGKVDTRKSVDALIAKARARAQLDELAKALQAESGGELTFHKAWAKAAAQNPELYAALRQLGGFSAPVTKGAVSGPGFDDGEDGDALQESSDFYTPRSADAEAEDGIYSGPRSYDGDGGANSNMDLGNVAGPEDEVAQLARCADDIRKASGYKLSAAQAYTRAAQAMPDIYKRMRAKERGR